MGDARRSAVTAGQVAYLPPRDSLPSRGLSHLLRLPRSPPQGDGGKLRGNRHGRLRDRRGADGAGLAVRSEGRALPSRRRVTYPPQAPAEEEEEEDRQVPHASQAPLGSAAPRRSAGPLGRRRAGAGSRRGTIGPGGRRCPGAPSRAPRPAGGRRPAAEGSSRTCPRRRPLRRPSAPGPAESLPVSSQLLLYAPARFPPASLLSPSPPLAFLLLPLAAAPAHPMRCGSPPPPLRCCRAAVGLWAALAPRCQPPGAREAPSGFFLRVPGARPDGVPGHRCQQWDFGVPAACQSTEAIGRGAPGADTHTQTYTVGWGRTRDPWADQQLYYKTFRAT